MKKASMPAAAYAGPVSPPFTSTEKLLGMVGSSFDNAPVNVHQVKCFINTTKQHSQ